MKFCFTCLEASCDFELHIGLIAAGKTLYCAFEYSERGGAISFSVILPDQITHVNMESHSGRGMPSNGSVYVSNLPPGTDESMLAEFFGTIGLLKVGNPTRDKATGEPKGDGMVTYEDPHAAFAAVEWFNNKDFHGTLIGVQIAETKAKDGVENLHNAGIAQYSEDPSVDGDIGGQEDLNGGGRGRGRGDASGKAWQQDGDWLCPNTSCSNVNFAFRGVCNRCGTARPAGASGSGSGSAGRGRGRGNNDSSGGRGRAVGGPTGLFGPNDWPCPMCGNINWAKRTKCNICNTNKPGHNEGGVRGGRAGGYKELDEEEIEETRRRRREAEEDDGEMYDEFGNLKKKFRAKMQQAESAQMLPGSGRAGWVVEELGTIVTKGSTVTVYESAFHLHMTSTVIDLADCGGCRVKEACGYLPCRLIFSTVLLIGMTERDDRERRKDRGRDHGDRESGKNRDRDGHSYERERHRSRSRERERDRDKERGRDRDRDYDYDRGRDYGRDRDRRREW
ncbi:TATA-binding protein-associated factor 2N [Asimina triloba]